MHKFLFRFLVTYSRDAQRHDTENCLRIFDVFTGEMKKAFSPAGHSRLHDWPFLKWSHDEKYFAFCRPKGNTLNIFDTEQFSLLEGKPFNLDGLVRFEFNPAKNMIAYYCEERVRAKFKHEK